MPRWSQQPPPHDDGVPFRLVRVPADKTISGVVTSEEPLGCPTHFANNRTVPCEGEATCPLCKDGSPRRWHCYAAVLLMPSYEHVILELTGNGSDPLRNYWRNAQTIRACLIQAYRPSHRPNGRVVLTCKPGDEQRLRLPPPPHIARIMCSIWNVPYRPDDEFWDIRSQVPEHLKLAPNAHRSNGDGNARPLSPQELLDSIKTR